MSWQDDVEENIKCGLIDILILKMLLNEDMYGYQIKQEMNRLSDGGISIKEGSLYGPLYRMLDKGFISTYRETVGKKRFRNYYHIEDQGRQFLDVARSEYLKIIGGADKIMNQSCNIS